MVWRPVLGYATYFSAGVETQSVRAISPVLDGLYAQAGEFLVFCYCLICIPAISVVRESDESRFIVVDSLCRAGFVACRLTCGGANVDALWW